MVHNYIICDISTYGWIFLFPILVLTSKSSNLLKFHSIRSIFFFNCRAQQREGSKRERQQRSSIVSSWHFFELLLLIFCSNLRFFFTWTVVSKEVESLQRRCGFSGSKTESQVISCYLFPDRAENLMCLMIAPSCSLYFLPNQKK